MNLWKKFCWRFTHKNVVSLLSLFSFFGLNASPVLSQEILEVPPIEGYIYGNGHLASSPQTVALIQCGDAGVHHMDEFPNSANPSWPSVYLLYCGEDTANGFYSGVVNYAKSCYEGNYDFINEVCLISPSLPFPYNPPSCPEVGNPINPIAAAKIQTEIDIPPSAGSFLFLERRYNSSYRNRSTLGIFGRLWRTNFDTNIRYGNATNSKTSASETFGTAGGYPSGRGDYRRIVVDSQNNILKYSSGKYSNEAVSTPELTFPSTQQTFITDEIDYAYINHPDGSISYFTFDSTSTAPLEGIQVGQSTGSLTQILNVSNELIEWLYVDNDNVSYHYRTDGSLFKITQLDGYTQNFFYELTVPSGGDGDDRTLDKIVDSKGRELVFTWGNYTNNWRFISQIQDPDGQTYSYNYDAELRLTSVDYPSPDAQLKRRTYLYNHTNPAFSWALTGIIDERGVEYVRWSYDTDGRAYDSRYLLATNTAVNNSVIDYSAVNANNTGQILTTNPLGHETAYHLGVSFFQQQVIRDERKENVSNADVSCVAADTYYSYDADGFKDVVVDWEGNAVDYDHDSLGRETQRVEGLTAMVNTTTNPPIITTMTTAETRTVTTEWHPAFRLPTRITEPDKVTDMTYHCDNGRLLNQQIYSAGSEPNYVPPNCP